MLVDSELRTILEALPTLSRLPDAVEKVLGQVLCCPSCKELFTRQDDLSEHLRVCHADEFGSRKSRQIADHCVRKESEELYICPHCHYAVGAGREIYSPNATSTIFRHVQTCPLNPSARNAPASVSFLKSRDGKLIEGYLCGRVEIELFTCPRDGCILTFGSEEALVQHLVLDHSSARSEDLPQQQLRRIRLAAQEIAEEKATTPGAPPSAIAPTCRPPWPKSPLSGGPTGPRPNPLGRRPGRPRRSPSPLPIGQVCSWTARQKELDRGWLCVPRRLASHFPRADQVTVHLPGDEQAAVLPFDPSTRHLKDLTDWLRHGGIEPGDKVKFELLRVEPPEIRIWTEWEKHINYVLRCPPKDFKWEHFSIRDCLIKVFADCHGSMHYRSLYSRISKHRELAVASVIATLSRYRGILFEHSGRGMWNRLTKAGRTDNGPSSSVRTEPSPAPFEVDDAIWRIVAEIEEGECYLAYRGRD